MSGRCQGLGCPSPSPSPRISMLGRCQGLGCPSPSPRFSMFSRCQGLGCGLRVEASTPATAYTWPLPSKLRSYPHPSHLDPNSTEHAPEPRPPRSPRPVPLPNAHEVGEHILRHVDTPQPLEAPLPLLLLVQQLALA